MGKGDDKKCISIKLRILNKIINISQIYVGNIFTASPYWDEERDIVGETADNEAIDREIDELIEEIPVDNKAIEWRIDELIEEMPVDNKAIEWKIDELIEGIPVDNKAIKWKIDELIEEMPVDNKAIEWKIDELK